MQDQDKSSYISVKLHTLVFHGHNINWFDDLTETFIHCFMQNYKFQKSFKEAIQLNICTETIF